MTLSIAEAMHQAQEAMNGGDFKAASQTCSTLVRQFPSYARAHSMLGEAYRELGQLAGAQQAFAESLVRNQRAPGAYLGLGLIAEDEGAPEKALAFCQVAWELAPEQRQLRDPLSRVAMRRYGSDGDLQLSHAALAQLHANASRLRRAVDAYRRALADLPDRVDLKLGMAECLWRMGHDAEAADHARAVLEQFPESANALVILADVEHRTGSATRADDLLRQLRAVDPDGSVVATMLARNPNADHAFLQLPPDAIPEMSTEVAAPVAERPRIAPAPDFEYLPSRGEQPIPSLEELEPISVEEFAGELDAAQPLADASEPFDFDSLGIEEDLTPISVEELGGIPEDFQPISPEEFGGTATDLPAFDLSELTSGESREQAQETFALDSLDFEDFSDADAVAPAAPVAPAWESTEPVDDLAALAASLEGDVADALTRAGEEVRWEADIEESRPPAVPPSGYTTMLESLGDAGLAPFDPRNRQADAADPAMPSLEMDDQLLEQSRPPAELDGAARLTADWDSIDDEILRAMPEGYQPGYTDELRSLDDIGLAPFEFEDLDGEMEGIAPFNPFAAEPAAPSPFAAPQSEAVEVEAPAPEAAAADPLGVDDELLGGLEPFSFEEFEQAGTDVVVEQSGSPWDAGASIVPSDEDLDALLAYEEPQEDTPAEPEPALEPQAQVESIESDLLRLAPDPMLDEIEQSIAVTRALPGDASAPRPEQAVPDIESAETRLLASPDDLLAEDTSVVPTSELTDTLRPGTEVFHRARKIKEELVSEGLITGDRELAGSVPTEALRTAEDHIPTSILSDTDAETEAVSDRDADEDEDDVSGVTFDSARDVATLRAALEITPDDDEMRWWLAEALREQGELTEAFTEYRWLIRNAPSRHEAVLEALNECVERGQSTEMAHRLLGDIYRRRGDAARASAHAALALQQRQRGARSR